ncbi:MAG: alpha/beta hydrolase [Alphaproteobacteria bacterium]|jgi:pimeloyl-ACP methyl ester carboxylesterase|nr:alpha/beta hydrolase [Alphaproteobacteria bacterium]
MFSHRRFFEFGRGPIEYAWHGPGPAAAPTLVFLHQGLGCAELWRDLPATLAAETGLGALVYSRYGYGGSAPSPLPWPVDYMHREALEVLPEVLRAAGVREAILVGHSDGASIAIIHAGAKPAVPILGLVLESAHVFTETDQLGSIDPLRRRYRGGGLRAQLGKYHGDNVDNAFFGWADAWQQPAFRDWNLEAYLPEITVPILLLQGLDDDQGSLAQVRAIEAQAGGTVRTLVLENCGHSPNQEQRERYLEAVRGFVSALPQRTSRLSEGARIG